MKKKEAFSSQKRKQLQDRLHKALLPEIKTLSTEMQQILCDDLVTSLQNRLIVLVEAGP